MNKQSIKYGDFVLTALFAAIIFIMAFTPIGFINLGLIKATIIHVPVIIGSIVLGPKRGAILGGIFGLTSLIVNSMNPSLLSFAFSPVQSVPGMPNGSPLALIVCFIPRILVGIVPYYIYRLVQNLLKNSTKGEYLSLMLGGIFGAVTNTVFVMGLIYLLFKEAYAAVKNVPVNMVAGLVLGVVGTNGIPEAIVAGIITVAVCKPLLKMRRKRNIG